MTDTAPATRNTPDRRRNIVLLIGFGAVLVLAFYTTLYWHNNPPLSLLGEQRDKDRIDLFAEQIHGIKFDSDGKLVETLWAQRLDHYPERNESILAKPVLEAKSNDGKTWKMTAATGTLIGEDEMRLYDDVVIVDREQTLRFESERLDYFFSNQQAATDAAVKLQRAADVTTAIGLRANLNTNRIELLRNVDSHYAQIP
jgi:lipopolysaccharide export system protein LptC